MHVHFKTLGYFRTKLFGGRCNRQWRRRRERSGKGDSWGKIKHSWSRRACGSLSFPTHEVAPQVIAAPYYYYMFRALNHVDALWRLCLTRPASITQRTLWNEQRWRSISNRLGSLDMSQEGSGRDWWCARSVLLEPDMRWSKLLKRSSMRTIKRSDIIYVAV